jgi:hypothetical protein
VYFEISYLSNTEGVRYILIFDPGYSEIMISCAYMARELNISPSTVSRPGRVVDKIFQSQKKFGGGYLFSSASA